MENTLSVLMIIFLCVSYLIIAYGIYFKNSKNNFTTWVLWTAFDTVGFYGTLKKGEDPKLLLTFAIGSALVALTLWLKKKVSFGWVEFFISLMVIVCIYLSQTQSPSVTIWATAVGLFLAGIPNLKDLRTRPISKEENICAFLFWHALFFGTVKTILADELFIIPLSGCLYWTVAIFIIITHTQARRRRVVH